MSVDANVITSPVYRKYGLANPLPYRLTTIAALLASLVILTPVTSYAAGERSVDEIQSEVARLKQLLEKAQQELAGVIGSMALPASVSQVSKVDEPEILGAITVRGASKLDLTHDVAQSVSVVSGGDLDRELAQDYNAISKRAANVTFNQSNTRGASLSIRGVGKRAFSEVQDPSVLVIQDGVSFGLTALGNFDFYDIDSVESSRGPQGTLGGKGGSSGVVNITTKRPSFTPSSDFSLTYGQLDTVIVKAATGGSLIDDLLAWRGAVVVNKGAGYYKNTYDSNFSLYNKNRLSGRVQFLLTPTPDLSARVSVDIEPHAAQLQNGLSFRHDQPIKFADGSLTDPSGTTARARLFGYENAAGVFTGPRSWFSGRNYTYYGDYVAGEKNEAVNFNENQGQTVSNKGASAEVIWDVANHTFTSITAWRRYSFDAHNDEGTPFDISKNGGGGVLYNQYSQELRVNSKPGGVFDYQAGLFLFKTDNDIAAKTGWGSDAGAWFATTAQYNTLDRNAGTNRGAGLALLKDTLSDAFKKGDTIVNTKSNALYGQGDWHLSDAATLTAGLRVTKENRSTEDTVFLTDNGVGGALNPVEIRGIALGGFNSAANGSLVAGNSAAQLALADTVAQRYYGVARTSTAGAAYNSLTAAQKNQVAAAKSLRSGQIGQLISKVRSEYKDTLYNAILSPSYKFNEQVSVYGSLQYGDKSGTAFNINGVSANVKPEKTSAVEFGFKSFLLNKTLTLNMDVFIMDIANYQQAIRTIDDFTTQTNIANGQANPLAYTTAQGNVNKVRVQGIEFDGAYSGIPNINIRFSGAYNDARYKDFKNAPKPDELAYLPQNFIDLSGQTLPGAAKLTFNVGAEYRRQIFSNSVFHTSFNTAYTSSYNNVDTLSSYGEVPAYSLTDASIGIGKKSSSFDVSLVVKNMFDKRPHEAAWTSYEPYPYPRWAGIVFSSHL